MAFGWTAEDFVSHGATSVAAVKLLRLQHGSSGQYRMPLAGMLKKDITDCTEAELLTAGGILFGGGLALPPLPAGRAHLVQAPAGSDWGGAGVHAVDNPQAAARAAPPAPPPQEDKITAALAALAKGQSSAAASVAQVAAGLESVVATLGAVDAKAGEAIAAARK